MKTQKAQQKLPVQPQQSLQRNQSSKRLLNKYQLGQPQKGKQGRQGNNSKSLHGKEVMFEEQKTLSKNMDLQMVQDKQPSHQKIKSYYKASVNRLSKDVNSRNSLRSLGSRNRLHTMSSKGLLTTMQSNPLSQDGQSSQNKQQNQQRNLQDINRQYFSTQDSQDLQSKDKTDGSSEQPVKVEEFSSQKSQSKTNRLSKENDDKRDSLLSNFVDEDMSERSPIKGQRKDIVFVKEVKQSVKIKSIQPLVARDTNKKSNIYEYQQRAKQQKEDANRLRIRKPHIYQVDDSEKKRNSKSPQEQIYNPEGGKSSRQTFSDQKNQDNLLQISKIQHRNQNNESKQSETDIKLWMHLSDNNDSPEHHSKREFQQQQNSFHMIRESEDFYQNQKDPMDLSLPVEINDNNEYETSNSQSSEYSTNTQQGIKKYLNSLNRLKERYQEICNDLIYEENYNIQVTMKQILESDEFQRLSLNSKSQLLTKKIIDIRNEYRHVVQLLKNQHNFEIEYELNEY